jgi:hypothetical protein
MHNPNKKIEQYKYVDKKEGKEIFAIGEDQKE